MKAGSTEQHDRGGVVLAVKAVAPVALAAFLKLGQGLARWGRLGSRNRQDLSDPRCGDT